MKSKIFIRGHHLSSLAHDYFDLENNPTEFIHSHNSRDISTRFIDNPDLDVEIVEGLDSICEEAGVEECPNFNPGCVFIDPMDPWDEDRKTLREYDLQVGQTYCASDVIERFIDFYNETGYKSPRNKFVVEREELI